MVTKQEFRDSLIGLMVQNRERNLASWEIFRSLDTNLKTHYLLELLVDETDEDIRLLCANLIRRLLHSDMESSWNAMDEARRTEHLERLILLLGGEPSEGLAMRKLLIDITSRVLRMGRLNSTEDAFGFVLTYLRSGVTYLKENALMILLFDPPLFYRGPRFLAVFRECMEIVRGQYSNEIKQMALDVMTEYLNIRRDLMEDCGNHFQGNDLINLEEDLIPMTKDCMMMFSELIIARGRDFDVFRYHDDAERDRHHLDININIPSAIDEEDFVQLDAALEWLPLQNHPALDRTFGRYWFKQNHRTRRLDIEQVFKLFDNHHGRKRIRIEYYRLMRHRLPEDIILTLHDGTIRDLNINPFSSTEALCTVLIGHQMRRRRNEGGPGANTVPNIHFLNNVNQLRRRNHQQFPEHGFNGVM